MLRSPLDQATAWMKTGDLTNPKILHALLGRPRTAAEVARLTGIDSSADLQAALATLQSQNLVDRMVLGTGPKGIHYEVTSLGVETWNEWHFRARLASGSAP